MNNRISLIIALSLSFLMIPAASAWERGRLEMTPYVAYALGGSFDDFYSYDGNHYYGSVDLDDGMQLGVRMGIGVARGIGIEFQVAYMPTAFYAEGDDSFFGGREEKITDVDLTMFQGSLMIDMARGPVIPYFGMGIGSTTFNMERGDDSTRFTASLAGGFRFRINSHLSFRTEIRGYGIWIDEGNDCYDDYGYDCDNDQYLRILESSFGLSVKI